MIIRRHRQPAIRMKLVRFAIAIATTAAIAIFLIYSHIIDAFSLGCRTLSATQVRNRQVTNDLSSYMRISSPYLQAKDRNNDDEIFPKRDIDAFDFTENNESIVLKDQSPPDNAEENTNSYFERPTPLLKRDKNGGLEVSDPFQALIEEMPRTFKTEKTVLEAIAQAKSLTVKVNMTMKDTQQYWKGIKRIIEETVEKTRRTAKDIQEISTNVKQSLQDARQSVSEKQESARDAVSKAKILFGLEQPNGIIQKTSQEAAIALAGKATIATVKKVLWTGKEVGLLAWKGSRSVYNNTIGPVVEEAWKAQLDILGSSANSVKAHVKSMPSRVTSTVTTKVGRVSDPVLRWTSGKNQSVAIQHDIISMKSTANIEKQPAFVSKSLFKAERKKKQKIDHGNSKKSIVDSMVKKKPKSLVELNKELDDAQKLATEISERLDVAERAMNMNSNNDLEDPMTGVLKSKTTNLSPSTAKENAAHVKTNKENFDDSHFLAPLKVAKNPDELDTWLEEIQLLEKEIADALETAEQELKTASTNSDSGKNKIDDGVQACFKAAKTPDELDTGLKEVQSLENEIADALKVTEKALKTASANSDSSENNVEGERSNTP